LKLNNQVAQTWFGAKCFTSAGCYTLADYKWTEDGITGNTSMLFVPPNGLFGNDDPIG
jgi:hypothetical protein